MTATIVSLVPPDVIEVVTPGPPGAPAPPASVAFADITGKPTTLAGYGITDGGGTGAIVVSEVEPVAPAVGLQWSKPSEGVTYVYYNDGDSSQWVEDPGVPFPNAPFLNQEVENVTLGKKWRCVAVAAGAAKARWVVVRPNGDVTKIGAETLTNKKITNPEMASQVLPFSAAPAWDANNGQIAIITVTGTCAIQLPTNLKPGLYTLKVVQDAIGNRTVTFHADFVFTTAPVPSTGANATDTYLFCCFGDGKLYGSMISKGGAAPPPPPSAPVVAIGTNLSGMEWTRPGLRYGESTRQNFNFTPPRPSDVQYLANQGMTKNRLCIQWELLQPILLSVNANGTVLAAHGVAAAGDFYEPHASMITGILDAHAAAGIKCIIDLHNYFRYQDFIYEADGSVVGFTDPVDPLIRPYTTNNTKVQVRIASKAAGATLTVAQYVNFWEKVATRWRTHAGFGGYGLMNEPNTLPAVGGITEGGSPEDKTITPHYHQAAINAIRAIDATGLIYVSGNNWDAAMTMGDPNENPGFPLTGTNLIYEVHLYLDAYSNGANFDYDIEVGKNFSAGLTPSNVPIDSQTGFKRIKLATDWAATFNPPLKLALTEIGMPVDDVRWQTMYKIAVDYAYSLGVEIYSWMGGNHWPIHNYAINHVPGFHQNKTLPPLVQSVLRGARGLHTAVLFDDGDSWSASGSACTITVYARGSLATPINLTVASSNGGTFSKTALTLAAGVNSFDTFTFTPVANTIATLTYSGNAQVPPPRKVFALNDPVAYAATSLTDAALAIMAKYKASKWEMKDGFTDYMNGVQVANAGDVIRAISDSGYGSSHGNAMEMKNWFNKESWMQSPEDILIPTIGIANGKIYADQSAYYTFGWWCKKTTPVAGSQPNPKDKCLYNIEDPHFQIVTCAPASSGAFGEAFNASQTEDQFRSCITFDAATPRMQFCDGSYVITTVASSAGALPANVPAVVSLTSVQGSQKLRVNRVERGSATRTHTAAKFNQLMLGHGYYAYYQRGTFMGRMWGGLTGKGAITVAEIDVLEQYMATLA